MRLKCSESIARRLCGKTVILEPTMIWVGEHYHGYYDGLAHQYLHTKGEVVRRIEE